MPAQSRQPKRNSITSERGTTAAGKKAPRGPCSTWPCRKRGCHEGEGSTGTYKIRSVSPVFLLETSGTFQLFRLQGAGESVNIKLSGFLAQLPRSPVTAWSLITFINGTVLTESLPRFAAFSFPLRNQLIYPKALEVQISARNHYL